LIRAREALPCRATKEREAMSGAVSLCSRCVLSLGLLVLCVQSAAALPEEVERQIEQLIAQLGADDFAEREQAMEGLRELGDDALEALEEARAATDPEIRYRAEMLLREIQLGVGPNTPPDIAQQLEAYRTGERQTKLQAIVYFESRKAFDVLLRLQRYESDDYLKTQLRAAIGRHVQEVIPPLVLKERYREAEEFLFEFEGHGPDSSLAIARFLWATGRVDEGIARIEKRPVPKAYELGNLAALRALKEDWKEALEADAKSALVGHMASLLLGNRDWKTLAEKWPISPDSDPIFANIKRHSSQARLFQLADDEPRAREAWEAFLRLRDDEMPVQHRRRWTTRLLMLERFDEGFRHLEDDDPVLLAALRTRRQEFKELASLLRWDREPAFDDAWFSSLPTRPENPEAARWELAVMSARALVHCGRDDDARRVLETLERNPLPGQVRGMEFTMLAHAALEARQWERFLDHLLVVQETPEAKMFWNRVAPQQAELAKRWQEYFEQHDLAEHRRLRFGHVAQLAGLRNAPVLEGDELTLLLSAAENSAEGQTDFVRDNRLRMVADTALKHGRLELSARLYEPFAESDPSAALAAGDIAIRSSKRHDAARWYAKSWELTQKKAEEETTRRASTPVRVPAAPIDDPGVPVRPRRGRIAVVPAASGTTVSLLANDRDALLALYLQGACTEEEEEGQRYKRLALALAPSADMYVKLAQGLEQRATANPKLRDDAAALYRSIFCTSPLGSPAHATAMSHWASLESRQATDAEQVAERWEQARVVALLTGGVFASVDGYGELPRNIHLAEARKAISAEKWDDFAKAVDALERALPGDIPSYEVLYPLLVEKGRTKEVDALFERCHQFHRELLDAFPESAAFMNQVAWLCAISHRRLDDAQRLAEQAVKRQPMQAAYIDTLAEVHFQLGDRDKAVELSQQAADLSPHNPEMQERLAHFKTAELPQAKE
jgi:tetratricopeptide (TPR) repeat protein